MIDLGHLNYEHSKRHDKWYRMFCGAASILVSYESGIIHLEVVVSEKTQRVAEDIVPKMVKSWRWHDELKSAKGYVADVFKWDPPFGYRINDTYDPAAIRLPREKGSPSLAVHWARITGYYLPQHFLLITNEDRFPLGFQ